MHRKFIATAAVALALSMAHAANAQQPAQQTIKIGYSIAKTGILAGASDDQNQAYELWRDQVNARGGLDIGGKEKRKIEFVSYDDQSDGTKAAQIYEKLISYDKVDLLLAPYSTPLHIAIVPVVERYKFPVIGNSVSTTSIRQLKAQYMFFTEPLPDSWGASAVEMAKSLKVKRVAIVALQLPFSLELKKNIMPALADAQIEVVFNQEYPPDTKDMTTLLNGVKASNPDLVFALTYPRDTFMYMDKAREIGLNAPYQILGIGPTSPAFREKFGVNANGIISLGMWSRHTTAWPGAKEFFDTYQAKWRALPDDHGSSLAFASCQVLEQAVAKAGIAKDKLFSVLRDTQFQTLLGPVKYDANSINPLMPGGFIQIQNEITEVVWPENIATGKIERKAAWR